LGLRFFFPQESEGVSLPSFHGDLGGFFTPIPRIVGGAARGYFSVDMDFGPIFLRF